MEDTESGASLKKKMVLYHANSFAIGFAKCAAGSIDIVCFGAIDIKMRKA